MIVQDIVDSALRKIGVLAAGESPEYQDSADALDALNDLLDQWATERLEIYSITRTTWTIVSGTSTYTVGTGGTVNIARPVYIENLNFQDTASTPTLEYKMNRLTDDAYAALPLKTLQATLPQSWYYNPTFPLGTLTFWPVPTSATLQGVIYAATAVTEFATLQTTFTLPPAYRRMIRTNLALELATEYGMPSDPGLVQQASESKAAVKRANYRMGDLSFTADMMTKRGSSWNIYAGP